MPPARVPGLCMQAQPGSQEAQFGCPAALRPIAWPAPAAPWPGVMGIITWCPLLTIPPNDGMPGSGAYSSVRLVIALHSGGKAPVSWLLLTALQQAGQGTTLDWLVRPGSPQTVHIVTLQDPAWAVATPIQRGNVHAAAKAGWLLALQSFVPRKTGQRTDAGACAACAA